MIPQSQAKPSAYCAPLIYETRKQIFLINNYLPSSRLSRISFPIQTNCVRIYGKILNEFRFLQTRCVVIVWMTLMITIYWQYGILYGQKTDLFGWGMSSMEARMNLDVSLFLVACQATLHPALLVHQSVGPSVCWSVGPSVCRSVGLSVRWSVHPYAFFFIGQKQRKMVKNDFPHLHRLSLSIFHS